MITYEELIDLVLLETGQWIAGIDATMISREQFEAIIKRELKQYSRYDPRVISEHMQLYNGKVFDRSLGKPPLQINRIVKNLSSAYVSGGFIAPVNQVLRNHSWRYDRNTNTLSFQYPAGIYQVEYFVEHEYKDGKIESLSPNTSKFINLVVGRFLMILGRSRRAFVLNDLPFAMDGDTLYSEGKELYDSTWESCQTNSNFHLAIIS